jgi:hypothetical protein
MILNLAQLFLQYQHPLSSSLKNKIINCLHSIISNENSDYSKLEHQ